jgi:hypothetical protein
VVVSLTAVACGGDESAEATTETTAQTEQTVENTNEVPVAPNEGPPTVSAVGTGDTVELPANGGCWRVDGLVTCGDLPAPTCTDPAIPHVTPESDGVIGLSISAVPDELTVLWDDGNEETLGPGGSVAWRPQQTGAAAINVDLGRRGTGAFAICVDP